MHPSFSIFIVLIFSSMANVSHAQNCLPSKKLDSSYYNNAIDSLRNQFAHNKKFQKEFELPCLIALSQYPELQEVRIEFVYDKIRTTMAARPLASALFFKKKNRIYRIYINTDSSRVKGVLLHQLPFDAQVGIIAHELAHIFDYENKSIWSIIKTGVGYLFDGYRVRLEHQTDMTVIKRGLGWQLYTFTDFLFNCKDVPVAHLKYKAKFYYSPADFLNLLKLKKEYGN
jgi:hypothetical protein